MRRAPYHFEFMRAAAGHRSSMYVPDACFAWFATFVRSAQLVIVCALLVGSLVVAMPVGAVASPQQIRVNASTSAQPAYRDALVALAATQRGLSLDEKSLAHFRNLLERYGWPTVVAVGKDGVNAAAALTLLAGSDYAFQEDLQHLAQRRVGIDVDATAFARWVDEMERQHDNTQQVGTLIGLRNGKVYNDPAVNVRRADGARDYLGLPLLQEYLDAVQKRVDGGAALGEATRVPEFAKEPTPYTQPALRRLLGAMVNADQDARRAEINSGTKPRPAGVNRVAEVDRENLPKLKGIFEEHGFPTATMVGRDGVSSFLLLMIHATGDPAFQAEVLAAAEPVVANRGVQRRVFATFADRVRIQNGKKQIYGTQARLVEGKYVPMPVQDPATLDDRRARMALAPEQDYLDQLEKTYGARK